MGWFLGSVGLDPFVPGLFAGYFALVVSQFVHWPQLYKILKHPKHDTRAISPITYGALVFMILGMLAYGIYLQAWPIIINNAVGLAVDSTILGIKVRNEVKYGCQQP